MSKGAGVYASVRRPRKRIERPKKERKEGKEVIEEAAPLSILQQNLAEVAAVSRAESAVHKLARFSSRLYDATTRRDDLRQRLKKLAGEMNVHKDRSHPIVQCRDMLRTSTFLSLRRTVDAIKTRTPKDQIGLSEEQADSVRLEARISEMQTRIVGRLLGEFWTRRQGTDELSKPVKIMLRSARAQAATIHRLVADSMEEFDVMRSGEWAIRKKAKVEVEAEDR
ncbi:hypothetical protein FRC07_001896 [Ceratobasidium sp. 392]|nr:hypothetical protein FRC07_001896 [Ceratobasidium sp. 392]